MVIKTVKRAALLALLLAVFAVPALALAAPAAADHNDEPRPPAEAAELCRELDEAGALAAIGSTRGECVNFYALEASEQSNNYLAAACGLDRVQADTGTTNKGQCMAEVKILNP